MQIIDFLIGATGISTIIIFLSKWLINYMGKMGIESYKSELQKEELKTKHKFEIETERHRAELSKLNLEFQIKLSELHVNQFEVMRLLYSKLIKAEKPLEYLTRPMKLNPEKSQEEIADEVVEKGNDFIDFFDENEIILNADTAELIHNIKQIYLKVWSTYSRKQIMGDTISSEMRVRLAQEINKAYEDHLQKEMQDLKEKLKEDFRTQTGIIEKI